MGVGAREQAGRPDRGTEPAWRFTEPLTQGESQPTHSNLQNLVAKHWSAHKPCGNMGEDEGLSAEWTPAFYKIIKLPFAPY